MNKKPLPQTTPLIEEIQQKETRFYSQKQVSAGLVITMVGLGIFLLGARPGLFGLDRSPVIGFVQIAVFTIGQTIICLGGYLSLMGLWKSRPISIAADIGVRLVTTGYVVAAFSGMADVFGFGSQTAPAVPYFGPLQAGGVVFGQAMISIGFLLLIPFYSRPNKAS